MGCDPNSVVLIPGYETGFDSIDTVEEAVCILNKTNWWDGDYEYVDVIKSENIHEENTVILNSFKRHKI